MTEKLKAIKNHRNNHEKHLNTINPQKQKATMRPKVRRVVI